MYMYIYTNMIVIMPVLSLFFILAYRVVLCVWGICRDWDQVLAVTTGKCFVVHVV